MYYVYAIVEKQTGRIYTGYTADLKTRLVQHNISRGARYTKTGEWFLAYQDDRARYQLFHRIRKSLAGQNRCGMKSPDRLSG